MPQMMPMYWELLLFYILIIYLMFLLKCYWIFLDLLPKNSTLWLSNQVALW